MLIIHQIQINLFQQHNKIDLKANLAGPTFTGTVVMNDVSGNDASFNVVDIQTLNLTNVLSASSVGLGNVDNTSDTNKPVSTAQQTALDLKANLASPTFTGTVVMNDVSGNDASFNVVDIVGLAVNSLTVGGTTIDTNGSTPVNLATTSVSDLSDVSFNTVSSGQVLSWNTDGYFEPTTQTSSGNLNSNSDLSLNNLETTDISSGFY